MAMFFGSPSRIAILEVLLNRDRSALQIVSAVKQLTRGRVRISPAAVYTMLHRMEVAGLIEGSYRDETGTRRRGHPRRYYEITATGKQVFNEFVAFKERGWSAIRAAKVEA